MAEGGPRKFQWRGLLRTIHRDAGNLAIGLTLIYALSGLAVNHINTDGWDPNFTNYSRTHELGGPLEGEDQAVANKVLERLGIKDKPSEVYRGAPTELEISFKQRTLHVNTETGKVLDEGQNPRFFLRVANWLHLNRGKKAWTYIADAYAVALLFLAFSGMFMLPGRKGLIGRGGIFVLLGIAVPVIYVTWSGGP
jgi:uncharacterized protein